MKKRIIKTDKTVERIISLMKQFSDKKIWNLGDNCRTDCFYLFKGTKNKWTRTSLSFVFCCRLFNAGESRTVEYRVLPGFSSFVSLVLLASTLISAVLWAVRNRSFDNKVFFFISVSANLFFSIFYFMERHTYIQEFTNLME